MIKNNINEGVDLLSRGISIKIIEKKIKNPSFHKLAPLIKQHYPNKNKLGEMEIDFIIGQLRKYELDYIVRAKERKKGQTVLQKYIEK